MHTLLINRNLCRRLALAIALGWMFTCVFLPIPLPAAEPAANKPLVRELFVPFDDLQVLLEGDVQRVFLSKPDYEQLLSQAKQKPAETKSPWNANAASAKYEIHLADGRATINGDLEIDLLKDELLAIPLQLSGVGLRSATWDGSAAAIGRSPRGPIVFGQGKGLHQLALQMVAPVTESAAQQSLQVTLPVAASTSLTVVVAGNVELKGGAAVSSRKFDEAAGETTFQLVPPRGPLSLIFSLNNRQKRAERVLVARSVIVDEVTLAYERIHARVAFRVLHGSTEALKIGIPNGFEVTEVASPLLARWTATQVDGKQVLELTLREPVLDAVEIDLSAVKLDVDLADWKFPSLTPQDMAGHVALAAVLLEDRLRLGNLTAKEILPIDAAVLADAIPASVLQAEPGSPSVRQVATYYAPNGQVDLSAPIIRPAEGLRVVASSLLLVEEKQVSLHGGLALSPQAEEAFSLALQVPPSWRISEVLHGDGTSLPMEQFDLPDGGTRVLLRFPEGLPIGVTTSLQYLATSVPEGWLTQQQSKTLTFPVIKVEGAERESGAIAIHAIDDLKITPLELTGLLPLLENEKANYGFADLPTTFAYYYDVPPYAATLKVESLPASLTADIYEFFRVERDHTAVHYEVAFTVRERRTRTLRFYLPSSTPAEIALRGINVNVKDYSSKETVGERRRWVVQLAERQGGVVRLAIDFDLPHPQEDPQGLILPLLVADDVDYQSALVAVEGSTDLQVEVTEHPRLVDVGELSGAEYQLGKRVIGTYGYNGTNGDVKVNVTQHEPYDLPTAIVQRAELVTILDPASRGGKAISQSSASYVLRTKASLLEVELPAGAELWTILLDGQPTKPQRQDGKLLVSLPTASASLDRYLQLVYQVPSSPLDLSGTIRQAAPKLRLPGQDQSHEIDTADLVWHLRLPGHYHVSHANGTVFRQQSPAVPPAMKTLHWLYETFGGVGRKYPLAAASAPIGGIPGYFNNYEGYKTREDAAAELNFLEDSSSSMSVDAEPATETPQPNEPTGEMSTPLPAVKSLESTVEQKESGARNQPLPPQSAPEMPAPADPFGVPPTSESLSRPESRTFSDKAERDPRDLGVVERLDSRPMGTPPGAGSTPLGGMSFGHSFNGLPEPGVTAPQGGNASYGRGETNESFGRQQEQLGVGEVRWRNLDLPDLFAQGGEGQPMVTSVVPAVDGERARRQFGLEGVSSLPISIEPTLNVTQVQFTSLGSDPELVATLVDDRRLHFASWGVGLLIFVVGMSLTCSRWAKKVQYVLLILVVASLLAMLPGMFQNLLPVFDAAFFAGTLVALYFVAIAMLSSCCRCCSSLWPACCRAPRREELIGISHPPTNGGSSSAVTSSLLLLALLLLPSVSSAQNQPPAAVPLATVEDLIKVLDGGPAPKVPDDAVLIPYDPNDAEGIAKAEKILVPYAKYVELWNRAHPDQKLTTAKPPAEYGIAGQSFTATLGEKDQVVIQQSATLHVFAEGPVQIPLRLDSGVIAEARVDGEAARLQLAHTQPPVTNAAPNQPPQQPVPQQQDAAQQAMPPQGFPPAPIYLLYVEGKGEKKLELTLRFAVTRQGGWRSIEGILPVHEAAAFTLTIPQAETEVRLAHLLDRPAHETKAANEKIENALPPNGRFRVEWRPKVANAQVDPSLTANSQVLFDVREDALRLIWQVTFQFRGAPRESFELGLPADYLVEKVAGGNVRGWQTRADGEGSLLDVTLLKPAAGHETITLYLARRGTIGNGNLATFGIPNVVARDAVLQQGELLVRRSPRMELQTDRSQGVSRNDVSAAVTQLVQQNEQLDASVLSLRQYQAYRFASVPFALELKAIPATAEPTANVHSLLRLAERQTRLETSFELRASTAPIYRVRALVPKDFDIEEVVPAGVEWSTTPQDNQQLVQVLFAQGQEGTTHVTLRGKLPPAGLEIAAPRIEVLDVSSQEGEMVVQADPDVDIQVLELKNGENVFLMQSLPWLQAEQHALAKVAVRYRTADYNAIFKRIPRSPVVTVQSLTNLKVTQRAVEQTSILDFNVAQAGIHEVVFQLPKTIARSARIKAELLQQRLPDEPVADRAGWVRVRLVLQDDLIGHFRVLIEYDGLVTNEKQSIALPKIETGRVEQQLLAVESAGRDEVVIDAQFGVEAAARQQASWRTAAALLGDRITAVYAAEPDAAVSQLDFHLQDRARVETSGAQIGLSVATLTVDAAGAYRGQQVYRVQNFTEPYLEVRLPQGASLWTAVVAGEPVKPVPGQAADQVRVPLVKSAEGESDYEVVLKYGGTLPAPGMFRKLEFPLMQSVNINVEESVVNLHLPPSQQWFNFDGTMRQVEQDTAAEAYLSYFNKQLLMCTNDLQSANPFTQARAQNNLKQLKLEVEQFNRWNEQVGNSNKDIEDLSYRNSTLVSEGIKKVQELNEQDQATVQIDNRARLNSYFNNQQLERSKNVVTKLGNNFDSSGVQESKPAGKDVNEAWLLQNSLRQPQAPQRPATASGPASGKPTSGDSKAEQDGQSQSRFTRGGKGDASRSKLSEDVAGNKALPQIGQGKFADELKQQLEAAPGSGQPSQPQSFEGEETRNLRSYQHRLEQQLDQVQQLQSELQRQSQGQQSGGALFGGGGLGGQTDGSGVVMGDDLDRAATLPQSEVSDFQTQQRPQDDFSDLRSGRFMFGVGNNSPPGRQSNVELAVVNPGPSGMASLDVALPVRGTTYYFKKVRGDARLTGRSFDATWIRRWTYFAVALIVLVLAVLLLRTGLCVWVGSRLNTLAGEVVFTVLALLAFLTSVFPYLAFVILLIGLVRLFVRLANHLLHRRQAV